MVEALCRSLGDKAELANQKISIVGNSCAGKSSLARALGKYLGMRVFTIDKLYWLPGWKLCDERSFKTEHDRWLSHSSWIIDGVGYWRELEERVSKSDKVIFLDIPVEVCKERAKYRITCEELSPNPDITEGCVYGSVKERQMEAIEDFHYGCRLDLLKLLAGLSPDKVSVISNVTDLRIEGRN